MNSHTLLVVSTVRLRYARFQVKAWVNSKAGKVNLLRDRVMVNNLRRQPLMPVLGLRKMQPAA